MSKILALDIGRKRIGLAMCDTELPIPEPLYVLERAGKYAEKMILEILQRHSIQTLVVGLPLGEGNEETAESESIRRYVARFEKRAAIKIEFVDEYASSEEALEALRHKSGSKKGMLDSVAASIILQRYLDVINHA